MITSAAKRQPQQGQPPGCPCRRFFVRRDVEQDAGWRETRSARPRDAPSVGANHSKGRLKDPIKTRGLGEAERQSRSCGAAPGR